MTAVQMRALEARDLDRVAELEPELFGVGAWSRQTYEQEIERDDRVYLAAVDDGGTLLGYGGVALDPEWTIMTVGVAPQARRRGVATALLDALVDAVRDARGTELFLEVRAHDGGAQQLYRNAGFVRVGLRKRYYQPEGADAVVMRLNLGRRVGAVGAEVTSAPAEPTGPDEALGVHASSTAPGAGSRDADGAAPDGGARERVFVDVDAVHTAVWSERPPTVLDVRWALGRDDGREVYGRGHLPGAVFVDLDAELAGPASPASGRHPLPDPEALQAAARRWGISADSSVVVYDDAGGTSAARAWWLLRWAGVQDVRIVDGGLRAWVAAGHHLEDGFVRPRPGDVLVRPGALRTVGPDEVADHPGVVLDARDHVRFTGEVEPVDPRAGHIPGAVSAPTKENLSPDGWLLEADDLRRRFDALGVRPGVDVAVYCGSGVTAAHQVAVLASLGVDAALYPGSFSQWSNDPGREVATGE